MVVKRYIHTGEFSDGDVEYHVENDEGHKIRIADGRVYGKRKPEERYNIGSTGWVNRESVKAKIAVLQAMLDDTE